MKENEDARIVERKVEFTESARYTCLEDLQQTREYTSISAINLDYCGRENCTPGHKFGPFIRADYVIHIIVDGKGYYGEKNKKFDIKSGQAFLIYPGEETVYQADKENPWSYFWIGFCGFRAEEFAQNMGFSHEYPVVEVKQIENVKQGMMNMLKARQLTRVNELRRLSELLQIFSFIMEDNSSGEHEEQHDYPSAVYVKCAMDYMFRHYNEKIKIDDLADYIGISRSHLAGSFKKELKMSPQKYLINLRMENAASMLKKTSEPINMIASASGYEDSLSFSKVFKQKYSMSPKAYRDSKVELIQHDEKGKDAGTCLL